MIYYESLEMRSLHCLVTTLRETDSFAEEETRNTIDGKFGAVVHPTSAPLTGSLTYPRKFCIFNSRGGAIVGE